MINRVVLVGHLTKDQEFRYTPNGIASCRFTLAVNRTFTNEHGERDADFINCVAWRKQAENLANYQRKGNLLGIEGHIQTGSYEGQDGKRVYTTDVVADSIQFLEPRTSTAGQPNTPQYQAQPSNSNHHNNMEDKLSEITSQHKVVVKHNNLVDQCQDKIHSETILISKSNLR